MDRNNHKTAVIIKLSEWEKILKDLEELDDIRAYDKAKSHNSESIPFDTAVKEIDREKYE